ncbi:WD40 repeat domain-containing protein [Cytophagaceae bacterium AH-315-L13]|nr:WD40 repeat domain-containing protein [Cytophagaceae bacterium AH-315-L13]
MARICPYPGLRPFNEEESLYFKGRGKHIDRIRDILEEKKFLMVTGASGDGKSSLIFAGLLPIIKAGFLRAKFNRWAFALFRPERNPVANLAIELANCLKYENKDTVEANLQLGYSAIVDLYKNSPLFNEKNPRESANLFILVDQFEELFTYTENYSNGSVSAQVKLLSNLLLETYLIAKQEDLPIYVVCTMRSDYISHCAAVNGFPELIGESHFFVPRLKRAELINIIEEPALLTGNKISKRLVSRLVNDVKDGTDALPVLQHALNQIWHQYELNEADEMDLIHYSMVGGLSLSELPESEQLEIGEWFESLPEYKKNLYLDPGLHNVLNAHADEIFETAHLTHPEVDISKEESQHIIESTFKCLTKIDDNKAIRNRMTLKEIAEMIGGEELNTIDALLLNYRMEGNTLLYPFVKNGAKNGQLSEDSILDITHEALIRNWKKLKDWTNEEHESVKIYEDYNTQLERWLENDKKKDFLLPLGSLSYFETWYKNQSYEPLAWIKRYVSYDKLESQILNASNVAHSKTVSSLKQGVYDSFVTTHFSNIKDFIYQSRKNVDRKKKFARVVSTVISVLLVISVAALFWNIHLRKISKSNEIAMSSILTLEEDPTKSFRLAEAAYDQYPGSLAKEALLTSYSYPPYYQKLYSEGQELTSVKLSSDGKYIATASYDKIIRIWSVEGEELQQISGHTDFINSIEFSPDSKFILSVSSDSTIRLWSLEGEEVLKIKAHAAGIYNAKFISNSSIISLSYDNTASVWNTNGNKIADFKSKNNGFDFSRVSPNGQYIITVDDRSLIQLRNAEGELIKEIATKSTVNDLRFSNDSRCFVGCSSDSLVCLWNVEGELKLKLKGHSGPVYSVDISKDGKYLLTGSADKTIIKWDTKGNLVKRLKGHTDIVYKVKFSPSGKNIISSSYDNTVRIWSDKGYTRFVLKVHNNVPAFIDFSPNEDYVITGSSGDISCYRWKIENVKQTKIRAHTGFLNDAKMSPDGSILVTASSDNYVRIFDQFGNLKFESDQHNGSVNKIHFFPTDPCFLTTSSGTQLILWDYNGKVKSIFDVTKKRVLNADISKDGRLVLAAFWNGEVKIWNLKTEKSLVINYDANVYRAKFSKNGKYVAVGLTDHSIRLSFINGEEFKVLKGHTEFVYNLNFSPNGKFLVSTSIDKTARIWDLKPFESIELRGHKAGVSDASFSSDSKLIITESLDKTVILWNIQGQQLAVLRGHNGSINSEVFTPDDKNILTASDDHSIRLWDLNGNELYCIKSHKDVVLNAEFSSDGKYIISASDDKTAQIIPFNVEDILNEINIVKERGNVWNLSQHEKITLGID